jgi:hypothetical protein
MNWIGPPLVSKSDSRTGKGGDSFSRSKSALVALEKKHEDELAAVRDFMPDIDVTYGFNEDAEQEGNDIHVVVEGEGEGSEEEDDASTEQADDDDLGFIDDDDDDDSNDSAE